MRALIAGEFSRSCRHEVPDMPFELTHVIDDWRPACPLCYDQGRLLIKIEARPDGGQAAYYLLCPAKACATVYTALARCQDAWDARLDVE